MKNIPTQLDPLAKISSQQATKAGRSLKDIRITVNVSEVNKADIEKFYNFTYKY